MKIMKKTLKDILCGFDKIIIPDVQRDYVMGSGGKKFADLLAAMTKSVQKNTNFNFSCLVGYKNENNYFYVYDGQQRLATLIYLCAYLMNSADAEESKLLKKFSFSDRDLANSWLEDPKKISQDKAVDFTTYSLAKLIKEFIKPQLFNAYGRLESASDKISMDFLFNKVTFSLIIVDKISDAEQFFLDINDGLDLKSYEVFKAELFHYASKLLDKDSFKKFALKMENKWLKFFLVYSHKENKRIDGKYTEIVVNCEEMLIFFLQYCCRMMWIEEYASEEGYDSTNVDWLTKEHFIRIESILDAIVNEMKNTSPNALSCINYSIKLGDYPISYCKGQHWNICDKSYNAMLDVFLSNVYNINETRKDVVVWCYISKLPLADQPVALYEYLRFIKKVLNNNRKPCNYAEIRYVRYGTEAKYINYARYYVLGIPQYYTQCKYEQCSDELFSFLHDIIMLNKSFELDEIAMPIYNHIKDCKNEKVKRILLKEIKKQNSKDKTTIKKYEDLPFINGLVDNFLDFYGETCDLQGFCNDKFYSRLNNIPSHDSNHQYKDVLEFVYENNITVRQILFTNITIEWTNYCGTPCKSYGRIMPHTWCDFLTSENGIQHDENSLSYPLHTLPDGWINGSMEIIQPEETDVKTKYGFAAHNLTNKVGSLGIEN